MGLNPCGEKLKRGRGSSACGCHLGIGKKRKIGLQFSKNFQRVDVSSSSIWFSGHVISQILFRFQRTLIGVLNFVDMAAKILANLIVMGSGILIRGMVQAYRQALQNASKSGVAQETIQNAVRRGSKVMTEQEARQILGVTEQSSWEEIAQKYDNLFERNATNGSFYLQSKVHRAKECLEAVYKDKNQTVDPSV
ncbi:hypothetical protein R6Q57_002162 [Mikania cordata]